MNKRGFLTIVTIFVVLFVLFFGFSMAMLSTTGRLGESDDALVGVVEINGAIMSSKKTIKELKSFVKREDVKAIVVRIDSPGGAVAPSQEMFDALKRAKAKKPLVVSMGSTAASGGYYIACGADTIFANPGSVTGSIGVISQIFSVEELLGLAKINVHTLKTGPYKDSGSMVRPFTEQDRTYLQGLIDDIHDQFISDVATGRKLDKAQVRAVADGRVFTGRQALKLKLVDKMGSLQDAVEFVAKEAKIEGDPEVVYPPKKGFPLLGRFIETGVEHAVTQLKTSTGPSVEFRYTGQ